MDNNVYCSATILQIEGDRRTTTIQKFYLSASRKQIQNIHVIF